MRGLEGNNDDDRGVNNDGGTGCYFFDLEEIRELFTDAGLEVLQLEYITRVYKKSKGGGAVERRRIWIHGRFRKPDPALDKSE